MRAAARGAQGCETLEAQVVGELRDVVGRRGDVASLGTGRSAVPGSVVADPADAHLGRDVHQRLGKLAVARGAVLPEHSERPRTGAGVVGPQRPPVRQDDLAFDHGSAGGVRSERDPEPTAVQRADPAVRTGAALVVRHLRQLRVVDERGAETGVEGRSAAGRSTARQ